MLSLMAMAGGISEHMLTSWSSYNCDTYVPASSASVSSVGMSFIMLIIKQQYGNSFTMVTENTEISAWQKICKYGQK